MNEGDKHLWINFLDDLSYNLRMLQLRAGPGALSFRAEKLLDSIQVEKHALGEKQDDESE